MANRKHCNIWVVSASGGISITSSLWLLAELDLLKKIGRNTVAGDANVTMGRIVQRTLRIVIRANIILTQMDWVCRGLRGDPSVDGDGQRRIGAWNPKDNI